MRVAVTGLSGFVGRHLAGRLVARGDLVIGIGPEPEPPHGALEWQRADLREADALHDAVERARPDAILHLAAQSSAAASFTDPAGTFEVNTMGTWNLLEAVAEKAPRARVLAIGTGEVYGPHAPGTRVSEEAAFRPRSPYALSKAVADQACALAAERHGLDVVRTRSFGHTGPGQTTRFFLPSFIDQIARIESGRLEPVLRVGNLEVVRDLCDVRDVVEGYLLLLERAARGSVYNVCRGAGVALDALVAGLVEQARVPIRVEADPARMRPADVPYLVGDPTRMTQDIGWTATRPLAESIAEMFAIARAEPDTA
jgi:GDP-4-dehydro-6-deoxy-D-mannose reductase